MGKCSKCKYSAVCLISPFNFAGRFIGCKGCGRYFLRVWPTYAQGNEDVLEGKPDVCADILKEIPRAKQCAYCTKVLKACYIGRHVTHWPLGMSQKERDDE